jgi:acetolactate decarboxylase
MRRLSWLVLAGLLAAAGCGQAPPAEASLYQVSTLQALMESAYDGVMTCGELRRHGDLGLGTLDGLDGEMIVLDGQVYQAKADGKVYRVADQLTTPFATVTFFRPDERQLIRPQVNLAQLNGVLDETLPTRNLFYAARIDARLAYVKVRSIPAQKAPYPRLAEAARSQRTFELRDVEGTLVGLRVPEYAGGLNMPGWHWHFLSADRAAGGHVLEIKAADLRPHVQFLRRLEVTLPTGGRFYEADLTGVREEDIRKVEK